MSEQKIAPHRITKPIQLLAAWLVGLAIVDGAFLTAAATIQTPAWVPGALVVAAIANVPLFLISLFLLQTRFRPEMQEDSYYSEYIQRKYSDTPISTSSAEVDESFRELADDILAEVDSNQNRNKHDELGSVEIHLELMMAVPA